MKGYFKILTKEREECTIKELMTKRKFCRYYYLFAITVSMIVFVISFYLYLKTMIIGLPILSSIFAVMYLIIGIESIIDSHIISNLIYYAKREK